MTIKEKVEKTTKKTTENSAEKKPKKRKRVKSDKSMQDTMAIRKKAIKMIEAGFKNSVIEIR